MKTTYKPYKELIQTEHKIKENQQKGIIYLYSNNNFKKIVGYSFILFGLVSYPLPTGSIFFIGAGFRILNKRYIDLRFLLEQKLNKLKVMF